MTSILQVRKLTKRFGGLTAVSELGFEVYEGEILGLIGPNGAGKSTTFNLIAGAYASDAGEIQFLGKSLSSLRPHEIARRGITRTFQHNRPFEGLSVLENVLVGAHTRFGSNPFSRKASLEETEQCRRAEELVRFVGLGELRDAPVDRLSFGQGRLLEIARALAGAPKLVLLDEPAAGLTLAEAERIAAVIRGIAARGIAVLLIEHDMHFLLPLAHRVVVLNFGAKIAEGTSEQVRSHPAVVDAYLGDAAAL
ncbi:MAG TPA: ABC transporter ATP-binding protein [Burkholderiales bacterium]|nr:ABC transporter ATP-binding protein [Burkholderiales bacterium]